MASAEVALITDSGDHNSQNAYHIKSDKDSKYSWFVIACGFTVQVLIVGVLHGFGVFFVQFTHAFHESKARVAWIGSVAYGLSMTFGPLVSIMVNRLGASFVMTVGCIICAISVLSSSFVQEMNGLFGTFSFLYGIGACMAISPTMTIAPDYFDKYMTTAVGLLTAGSSIGTLIMAPLSQVLIDAIGWRNTFRVFTGTCLFSAMCCSLIRPLPSAYKKTPIEKIKQSPARKLMQELKLWKNRVFIVWTLAITCVMFGFYIPYVHLVSYAKDQGISPEKGSILVMTLGGCTAFGRVLFGRIVESRVLNRLHMHQLSMVVTGTAMMLLPLITSFTGIILYVVTIGLVDGCYVVLLPVLTTTLMAGENVVSAWGFLTGTCSVTFMLGPPVAGFLYDAFGSYNIAFHCAGVPVIGGAIILFLIPWAQRTSKSDNIIIVVSQPDLRHDYEDFMNLCETDSTPMTSDAPESANESGITSVTRRKSTLKAFKDQATSTSFDENSAHVPNSVHEAILMLQENAKIIANMLDVSKLDTIGNDVSEQGRNTSVKSRSEMIQHSHCDCKPSKMISIMSIPGGLTISQWEPTSKQDHDCSQSHSTNVALNFHSSPSQLSNTSSHQTANRSDSVLRDSSSAYLSSPGPFCPSMCKSPDNLSFSNIREMSPKHLNNLMSLDPLNVSPNELGSSENQSVLTSNPANTSNTDQASTSAVSMGSSATSPRGRTLCVIPEGRLVDSTNLEIDGNNQTMIHNNGDTQTVNVLDSAVDQLDHWLDDSPNQNAGLMSANTPDVEKASATSLHTSSSLSSEHQPTTEACKKNTSQEFDVFTHLFDDTENNI